MPQISPIAVGLWSAANPVASSVTGLQAPRFLAGLERKSLLYTALLVGVLVVSAIVRSDALTHHLLYSDELHTYRHAYGIGRSDSWPECFQHSDVVRGNISLTGLLRLVRSDYQYPPALDALVWALRPFGDPIRHFRLIGLVAALLLLASVHRLANTRWGSEVAARALIYTACSAYLIQSSQALKYVAFTPVLALWATTAFEGLLHQPSEARKRVHTAVYACATAAGMLSHYTFLALISAHLAHVLLLERRSLRSYCPALCLGSLLWAPWYVWALPAQGRSLVRWYTTYAHHPEPQYFHHSLTLLATAKDWVYVLLTMVGYASGVWVAKAVMPILFILVVVSIGIDARRVRSRLSVWSTIPLLTAFVVLVLATALAVRTDFSGPISAHYCLLALPLWEIALARSVTGLRSGGVRVAVDIAAVGAMLTVCTSLGVRGAARQDPLAISHPPRLSMVLSTLRAQPEVILYESVQIAKSVNTLYVGDTVQCVDDSGGRAWRLPSLHTGVRYVGLLQRANAVLRIGAPGWRVEEERVVEGLRVTLLRRGPGLSVRE